ncbi:MAG: FecR domain-containing protein [Rhodothermales bacterium]
MNMNEYNPTEQELLARLFDGSLSDADRNALRTRMRLDADLASTVRTVERLAAIIPPVDTGLVQQAVTEDDTRAAWKRVEARIGRGLDIGLGHPVATLYRLRWVAAAAAVLVVAVALSVVLRPASTPDWETVLAARGEIRTVVLDDGSTVTLNADSRLEHAVSEGADPRVVRLDGEARFEVASDGRAFVVETTEARVRVLGTQFTVRARGEATAVAVHEGRVAVEAGSDARELTRDEAVEVRAGAPVRVLPPDVARSADDWTRGMLTFQRVPLTRALVDVERRFDVEIALTGSWTGSESVSGSFPDQDVREVLDSLCRIYACEVRERSAAAGPGYDLAR